ncbi:hypothetical protein [Flavobacterium sp.]|uniref:hypothetical protein n=1 Tax=Flavobacterium sp. TaxID=239 RepID=UPI0037514258
MKLTLKETLTKQRFLYSRLQIRTIRCGYICTIWFTENGNSKKLAFIAVCNKLLKQEFAKAKSGVEYNENYRSAAQNDLNFLLKRK